LERRGGAHDPGLDDINTCIVWALDVPGEAVAGDEVGDCARDKDEETETAEEVEEGECAVIRFCTVRG
jgi:hypothetical protein